MEVRPVTGRIDTVLADLAERTNRDLERWAAPADAPAELAEAMRYAALGPGKRLRPALVHLAARAAADGAEPPVDPAPAAAAIELVHAYSLVHDDLPAMDDDVLRRGRPTVHAQFGEAMAILVGDGLLTRAFAVLCEQVSDGHVAAALAGELARGAGAAGMVGGQAADMGLCELPEGVSGVDYIHARKTAALFVAAARMGALCGGADVRTLEALGGYAQALGLAFQITDDLLDATAGSDQLGKTAGKDAAVGKQTYPALLGLRATAEAVDAAGRRALASIETIGSAAEPLRALLAKLAKRTH